MADVSFELLSKSSNFKNSDASILSEVSNSILLGEKCARGWFNSTKTQHIPEA